MGKEVVRDDASGVSPKRYQTKSESREKAVRTVASEDAADAENEVEVAVVSTSSEAVVSALVLRHAERPSVASATKVKHK